MMTISKLILTTFIAFCSTLSLYSQVDFTRYIDESSVPLLDLQDHLDPPFNWNMPGNVQVYLNEGINFLKEDNLPLAISNLDEAIKLDSSWIAFYYRGIAHKNMMDLALAEKDLAIAKRIKPDQAEIYIELGEVFHGRNEFGKATAAYEKAIELDPQQVYAYYNLAGLNIEKGETKKGLRYYQRCNEIAPRFPQAYMMQGLLKFRNSKKDYTSIALFDQAIAADSAYALTYFWRGLTYINLGKLQNALENWNILLKLQPENFVYTLMRGCLYIELEDFDNAFNDLRKALKARAVDEERFKAAQTILDKQIDLQYAANYLISNGYGLDEKAFGYLKKGFCLILAGKKKEAIEEFKNAEQIQPSATVYFLEALGYEHSGDHNTALHYYDLALTLDNDIFDAHKKRSIYRSELKDWKGAEADFNEMFRLQPNSPTVYRLRGLARSHEKNYQGAIGDLTTFLKTDSADYEVIRTRSVCLLMVGNDRAANDDMRKLLHLGAGFDLFERVANNYLILSDTVSAIDVWRDFADSRPRVYIPYMELAKIYVHQHNWDSAKVNLKRLQPWIEPEHMGKKYAEILYLEGVVQYEEAFYEEAINHFSKAIKYDEKNLNARYYRAKAYGKTQQIKKALSDLKVLKGVQYKDAETLYSALSDQSD